MRLGIAEVKVKTNIYGEPYARSRYAVYRSFLFGLVRLYMRFRADDYVFNNSGGIEYIKEIAVDYVSKKQATTFVSAHDARVLIDDIKANPDKYVREL